MRYLLIILFVLIFQNVSALCEENQVDINTATKQELVKIIYIGDVRAEQLIELRPFESIDDLIRIKGIGEVYLNKIKEQELACINGVEKEEESEEEEAEEEESEEDIEDKKENYIESNLIEPPLRQEVGNDSKEPEIQVIKLNTKNIKTEENDEKLEEPDKSNYSIYGFIVFCVLLGFLFALKRFRRNEFE